MGFFKMKMIVFVCAMVLVTTGMLQAQEVYVLKIENGQVVQGELPEGWFIDDNGDLNIVGEAQLPEPFSIDVDKGIRVGGDLPFDFDHQVNGTIVIDQGGGPVIVGEETISLDSSGGGIIINVGGEISLLFNEEVIATPAQLAPVRFDILPKQVVFDRGQTIAFDIGLDNASHRSYTNLNEDALSFNVTTQCQVIDDETGDQLFSFDDIQVDHLPKRSRTSIGYAIIGANELAEGVYRLECQTDIEKEDSETLDPPAWAELDDIQYSQKLIVEENQALRDITSALGEINSDVRDLEREVEQSNRWDKRNGSLLNRIYWSIRRLQ